MGHCKMVTAVYNCLPYDALCHRGDPIIVEMPLQPADSSGGMGNIWTWGGIKLSLVQGLDDGVSVWVTTFSIGGSWAVHTWLDWVMVWISQGSD